MKTLGHVEVLRLFFRRLKKTAPGLLLLGTLDAGAATFTSNFVITETNLLFDGEGIVVSGATLTIDGTHRFNSLLLTDGAVLKHSPCTAASTFKLDLVVTNEIVVSTGTQIDVSGRGYVAGRTKGNATNGAATGQSGGSYGGLGGPRAGGSPNAAYGNHAAPDDWGSGSAVGGSGGGLIQIRGGTLVLDGEILADGSGAGFGGGSGGGILAVVGSLSGSGSIRAGGASESVGGAGGGGRIAVYALDYSGFDPARLTAPGGTGPAPGETGTVYVVQGSLQQCVSPPSGLVSWWPAEGDGRDITGANHGTLFNGSTFVPGLIGEAFSFDGVDDVCTFGDVLDLNTNSASIELWYRKRPGSPASSWLIVKGVTGVGTPSMAGFGILLRDGVLQGSLHDQGSAPEFITPSTTEPSLDAWHHVALVIDRLEALGKLYVDGMLKGTASITGLGSLDSNIPLALGAIYRGTLGDTSEFFGGEIDEPSVYKRALSSNEIAAIYAAGSAGKCKPACVPPPDGLVSWWPGDNSTADIVGGQHGSLEGGAALGATGIVEDAFSFSAARGSIRVPYDPGSPLFNLTDTFTYELWVNLLSAAPPLQNEAGSPLIQRQQCLNAWPSAELGAVGNGSNLFVRFTLNSANLSTHVFFDSSPILRTGVWHHVAATYDRGSASVMLYVDGTNVFSGSYSQSIWKPTTPLWIGGVPKPQAGNPPCWEEYVEANIDEVSIYNRALSSNEIAAIYLAGSAGKCKPSCVLPPSGLVSWWAMDGNPADIRSANSPSATNGLTFGAGQVLGAVSLTTNGYIDIPHSTTLANQQFTLQAWARPDGAGPNDDAFGSVLVMKAIDDITVSAALWWRPIDGRFSFGFGNINSDVIISSNSFATGQFHFVSASYDGSTFKLHVNGVLEAATNRVKTIAYNSGLPWTIGASAATFRQQGFSRTWNGAIDEVALFSRALLTAEIAEVYAANDAGICRPQCFQQPPGLISWWPGDTSANDLFAGNHGSLQNGATLASGLVGQAFRFDGIDDYVRLPDVSKGLVEGTIELWFNVTQWTSSETPHGVYLWAATQFDPESGDFDGINLGNHPVYSSTGQLMFGIFAGGWQWAFSGITPDLGVWYHIAGTWGSGGMRIYVNGVLAGVNPFSGPAPSYTQHNLIGRSSWPNTGVPGLIDEVSVYSRALSSNEIAAIYAAGNAGKCQGPVGFHVQIIAPASGAQFAEEAVVMFQVQQTGGTGPFSYSWSSDLDGSLGTGATLTTTTLSPGIHRITILGTDAGGAADSASILVTVLPLSPIVTVDLQSTSDTGASSSDNITSQLSPIFDVIVNKRGRIELDYTGDGTPDLIRTNVTAGSHAFQITGLVEGGHTVTAQFIPISGIVTQASLTITVDATAPHVLSLSAPGTAVTPFSAIITWTTDEAAISQVDYGLDINYGNTTPFNGSFVTSHSITLTGLVPDTTYHFHVRSRDRAGNEGVSTDGMFTTQRAPDLVVTNIVISPESVQSGSTIMLAWVELNNGLGSAAGAWHDRVAVSNISLGQLLLLTNILFDATIRGSILSGTFKSNFCQLRLPDGLSGAGTLQFSVTADINNAVAEFNDLGTAENNNSASITRSSTLGPYPDLIVTQVSSPATGLPGQLTPLTWIITNQGSADAVGIRSDVVALSADQLIGSDQILQSFDLGRTIPAGQSIVETQNVILPNGLVGNRYFVVTANSGNRIFELVTTNNTAIATQAISALNPDLVVQSMTAVGNAELGQAINITWSVRNEGSATANANWSDRVYLSVNSNNLSGADVLATQPAIRNLTSGSGYTNSQLITLPLNGTRLPGNYYLVVATDHGGVQPESSETNNLAFQPITLGYPPLPDLVITNISVPVTALPGQTNLFAWTVLNLGSAAVSNVWTESIYLSTDATLGSDQLVTSFTNSNGLAASASVTRTQQVMIPITGAAGDLFLIAQIDSQNVVLEESETNNLAFSAIPLNVPSALTLRLSAAQISENAANPNLSATISRNGNISSSLMVAIRTSDTNELIGPATVTIPANQPSGVFNLTVRPDGVVDANKVVAVTASAAEFLGSTGSVTVLNTDLPRLTLFVGTPTVAEGMTTPVTVVRDTASPQSLTISLVSSSPGNLLVPDTVTIPANSNSSIFAVLPVDDTLVEQLRTFTITASAGGYANAVGFVSVVDNDLPAITLELATTNISEGAGLAATTGTIRRDTAGGQIFVALQSSDTTEAMVPTTVAFNPGQLETSFPVGAVDDLVEDGSKTNVISAFVIDSISGQQIGSIVSQTLVITDDDEPTLILSILNKVVGEGMSPATTASVRRNNSTNAALLVTLVSSATNEATVPPNVTIPGGQSTAAFPITTLDDGVTDGSHQVTITASASTFTSGNDHLLVTDANLPDLVVSSIIAPASVETEASFLLTYRVANQGFANANSNFLTRVYIGADGVNKGTLIAEHTNYSALATNQFFEQTLQFAAPSSIGQYWFTIDTDVRNSVEEILENNNFRVTALPVTVQPAYRATVLTDADAVPPGSPITLWGRALRTGSDDPVPNAEVSIHVLVGGTFRIITAQTDADGNYVATFTPLTGEVGNFTVIATHPGQSNPADNGAGNTDSFALLGMRLEVPNVYQSLVENDPWQAHFTVRNLSDAPLTGLRAETVQKPANITVTSLFLERGDALLPNGTNSLAIQLLATNSANLLGEVLVRLTSDQGVTAEGRIYTSISRQRAHLVASTSKMDASMVRGRNRTVEFGLNNFGAAATGPIALILPQIPWLNSPQGQTLPSLEPGEKMSVSLVLNPASDVALTVHNGSFVLSCDTAQLTMPFSFRCVSDATADLSVTAVDEFFFYGEGSPRLSNASVRLLDPFTSQEVARGITGTNGIVAFAELAEGPYTLEVSADKHNGYRNTVILEAGVLNHEQAFLSRQVVSYIWTVEPVEIEERVRISVEATFEVNVPAPVIVVTPTLIDLSSLTRPGQTMQVNVKMANHGLIAMQGVNLSFLDNDTFELKPLIENVGTLAAQSEVIVPVIARYKDSSAVQLASGIGQRLGASMVQAAAFVPSCKVYGSVSGWFKCGLQQIMKSTSLQGYWNCPPTPGPPPGQPSPSPSPTTPPPPPNPPGGSGGGSGGGGSGTYAPIQVTKTKDCNCDPPKPDPCPQAPQDTACMIWVVATPEDECHCETYKPIFLPGPCEEDLDPCTIGECIAGTCVETPVQITFGANLANGVCLGGSAQVPVDITPASARGMVTFVSADPSVVTVSGGYPTLTVTAMPDAGGKSTRIRALISGTECASSGITVATNSCDDGNPCTINDACVNGTCQGTPIQITFSQSPAGALCVGDSATITVTVSPAAAQGLVSFDSSSPGVATVSGGGSTLTVTGVAAGTAGIQAKVGGVACASTSVTIMDCPCDDGDPCTVDDKFQNGVCQGTPVQISFSPLNGICVGSSSSMSVSITPASAQGQVTFESANTSVATVAGTPPTLTVTGVGQGSTTIYGKIGGSICANAGVTVSRPTVSVSLDPAQVRPGGRTTVNVSLSSACPNIQVLFRAEPVNGSGGHEHGGNRPVGTFSATSVSVDSSGKCSVEYTASAFGGVETIIATVMGTETSRPLDVMVPNLVPLTGGQYYDLIGATPAHSRNHFIRADLVAAIQAIANDYHAAFPSAEILHINDISLERGGLFDISGGWNSPHQTHREGRQVDIRSWSIPTANQARFEQICQEHGAFPTFEGTPPHYHLDFPPLP